MILFFSYFCCVFVSQVNLIAVVARRVFIDYIINTYYQAQSSSMWGKVPYLPVYMELGNTPLPRS